jgi:hypothetical protein
LDDGSVDVYLVIEQIVKLLFIEFDGNMILPSILEPYIKGILLLVVNLTFDSIFEAKSRDLSPIKLGNIFSLAS